jgi:hypothetical protein
MMQNVVAGCVAVALIILLFIGEELAGGSAREAR